ncbi:hypothetical protein K4F52_007660 [Lecanicillium sp. MT-2017a]|nr:hypothetical protein K4F52_007660 [Lecanicillium sp. MT-2017a]
MPIEGFAEALAAVNAYEAERQKHQRHITEEQKRYSDPETAFHKNNINTALACNFPGQYAPDLSVLVANDQVTSNDGDNACIGAGKGCKKKSVSLSKYHPEAAFIRDNNRRECLDPALARSLHIRRQPHDILEIINSEEIKYIWRVCI